MSILKSAEMWNDNKAKFFKLFFYKVAKKWSKVNLQFYPIEKFVKACFGS